MKTIDDLIDLLEGEAAGAVQWAEDLQRELSAESATRSLEWEQTTRSNIARHLGRAEAYRHALAQARHVAGA